jgi:hypothetical protein
MKTFEISRFSWLSDEYDEGITATEIESMLNKAEVPALIGFGNPNNKRAKWEVKEVK